MPQPIPPLRRLGCLADCRAYEMASPVDKNNSDIKAPATSIGDPAALNQSAGAGGKLTYSTFRAFGDAQSAPYVNQYLATRKDGVGWLGHAITPPREGPSPHYQAGGLFNQFKAFSEDLSMGWLVQDAEPTLDPAAPPAVPQPLPPRQPGGKLRSAGHRRTAPRSH